MFNFSLVRPQMPIMSQTATLPRSIAAAALTITAVTASLYKLWASEKRRRLRRIVRLTFSLHVWLHCNLTFR